MWILSDEVLVFLIGRRRPMINRCEKRHQTCKANALNNLSERKNKSQRTIPS